MVPAGLLGLIEMVSELLKGKDGIKADLMRLQKVVSDEEAKTGGKGITFGCSMSV